MDVVLWVVAGVLAFAFLMAGALKLGKDKAALSAQGMGWVDDVAPGQVKAIGAVEVLGAIGLILPAAINVATVLVPLAATGLAVTMVGAIATHARRKELPAGAIPATVLLILSVFVAWGRFGPYSF